MTARSTVEKFGDVRCSEKKTSFVLWALFGAYLLRRASTSTVLIFARPLNNSPQPHPCFLQSVRPHNSQHNTQHHCCALTNAERAFVASFFTPRKENESPTQCIFSFKLTLCRSRPQATAPFDSGGLCLGCIWWYGCTSFSSSTTTTRNQ